MTDNDSPELPISGEQKLKSRRMAFYRYVATAGLIAAAIGFGGGSIISMVREGLIPGVVVLLLMVVVAVVFIWFCFDYFRRVDELDMMDNLWATMIGFYAYIVAFPSWSMLHDARVTSEPDQWAIWTGTIIVSVIAYFIRKLGWR